MPKKIFTYQQVASLADAILNSGANPTLEMIVQKLEIQDSVLVQKHFTKWQNNKTKIVSKIKNTPKKMKIGLSSSQLININKETLITAYEDLKKYTETHINQLENALSIARATLESTADGILMINNEGMIVDFNQKFVEMGRFPKSVIESGNQQEALKHLLSILVNPQELINLVMRLAKDPDFKGQISDCYYKDGRIFERYSQPFIVHNEIAGRVYSFRDVTEKRKAEEELRLRQRAIEASSYGVIITDAKDLKISYVNPAFEKITGYGAQDSIGKNCRFLQGKEHDQAGLSKLRLAIKEQREETVELRNYRKDGKLFWNELRIAPVPNPKSEITHYVGIITDITQRKAMEAQLRHQATHDKLTNLPNRTLLTDRVQQAIVHAKYNNTLVSILFLDLDRFKMVNDSLGHNTGDALLNAIATRLNACIQYSDTIARMGGDEFIVLLPGLKKAEEAIPIAKKILKEIAKPLHMENRTLNITTSIGISYYPKDGNNMDALFKNADIAMYKAKEEGGNSIQFYTTEMNTRITQLLTLENNLRAAVKHKELELHYQPVIELKTNRITGAEALLRWRHPKKGYISPLDFVPLAEETGLILPIGEWVLQTACEQIKIWRKLGIYSIKISINVSGKQMQHIDIAKSVNKAIKQTQINPHNLEIELTESILMENPEEMTDILNKLKKMKISLAIDDFGTGYSSLSYLKHFPVNKLKIDQSFIKDLNKNNDDKAIVLAIIAMAKTLGLQVTAEGIESKNESTFLTKNFCDFGQGYYYGKPMQAKEFTVHLTNQQKAVRAKKSNKSKSTKPIRKTRKSRSKN